MSFIFNQCHCIPYTFVVICILVLKSLGWKQHVYGLLKKYGFLYSIFVSLIVLFSGVFWPIFYMVIF